ncbi:DUF21 domain-containing protein [Hibiscus syriacus]|uniref:DUF21 domain-containing protein n=1 Tax=Hibiscus syriacus TaxID=106335 RepID=A0A6A2Y505_HIBSY|nr:DUF21 domain-containing protein [Hibiscus syriacus]
MMNTLEKTQISSSLSKFEDSPIFNYINSLSPIKPVKSVHVTQTFNPLSFASLPSIFTSPHVSSHKESRFLKCSTDPSKPKLSSTDGTKVSTIEEAGVDVQENFDPGVSLGEVSFDMDNEPSRIAIELPQTLKYDCGSPGCDPTPCVIEMNCVSQSTFKSRAIVPFVQEASQKGLSEEVQESSEKGLSDGVEAFRGVIQKSLDPGTTFCSTLVSQFPQDDIDDYQVQTEGTGGLSEINHFNESFEDNDVTNFASGSLTDYMENRISTPYSIQPDSNLHRGFRRRCLDFEMLAARRKSLFSVFRNALLILSNMDWYLRHHHRFCGIMLLLLKSPSLSLSPPFLSTAWGAILISMTLILLFGEIIPQYVYSRYGLAIGVKVAPFVRVLVWTCFPVAYQISKLLDFLLGHGHITLFRRAELKTLVDLHGNEAGKGGELTHDETTIIAGALELTEKKAKDAMTPITETFAIDINAKLDRELMSLILEKGHSRVPSCDDMLELKLDHLIIQLREIGGLMDDWLTDHVTSRLSSLSSPDDLFNFFNELRETLGGVDSGVMDDDQVILDPNSNLGMFLRR